MDPTDNISTIDVTNNDTNKLELIDYKKIIENKTNKDDELIKRYIKMINVDQIESCMNIYDKKFLLIKEINNAYVKDVWIEVFTLLKDTRFGYYILYSKKNKIYKNKYRNLYIRFINPIKFKNKWINTLNNLIKNYIELNKKNTNIYVSCNTNKYDIASCFKRNINLAICYKYDTILTTIFDQKLKKYIYNLAVYIR